ncbi:MAG TPA: peptide chain release factor N(5)-glutamine methyltransferase [Terriglobales bacterium]|nr:peptide chain release factor N(5)-glutamine methyltransferase [Terriglobales bacterium]
MLLRETLASAIDRLSAARVPSPRLNAELLLMFVLGCDRAYFYAHPERPLDPREFERYDEALAERARGIPAQYITGHQEFWGLDFLVSPAVLIPRPETEHVIETVLELMGRDSVAGNRLTAAGQAFEERNRIVDVGTGSGCIAIALATELPEAEIVATDISRAALEIARANAARQLQDRIQFHQTDLLEKFEARNFNIVVSNPPYVGQSEEDHVQLEVRKHEPHDAVFAGPSGLEIIERLIPQAGAALKPGGWLVMEISGTVVEGVKRLLSGWEQVRIVNDLQGIPRVVSARAR